MKTKEKVNNMRFFLFLMPFFPLGSYQEDLTAKVEKIEKAALDQRRNLHSGKVAFFSELTLYKNNASEKYLSQYIIWFNQKQIRIDQIPETKKGDETLRLLNCFNCEKEGYYVEFLQEKPKNKGMMGLILRKPSIPPEKKYNSLPNPRLLGYAPTSFDMLIYHHLQSVIGRTDREPPTLKKAKLDGRDCWLIQYKLKSKQNMTKYSVWFDPGKGNSVVHIDAEYSYSKGRTYQQTIKCDVTQFGKVWYPAKCVSTRVKNGQMIEKEVLDVTEASFNEPMDEKVFKLIGMDIPKGTPVVDPEVGAGPIWTGEKIDRTPKALPALPLQQSSFGLNPWLVGLTIFFSCLSGLAIWFGVSRKKHGP